MNGTRTERSREQLQLELLVTRCQLGDAAALDTLVEQWHPVLWGYLIGVTGKPEVAEEILQEGWLRILRGISRLQDPTRLRPWLFSIVRRTFIDRLRGRYQEGRFEPMEDEPADPEPPSEFGWQETEFLYQCLQRLTTPDRETIVLFYLRELNLGEVAEVLNIPVGTVKSRLHRARRELRRELGNEGVNR